jgi:hypothetical protein
MRIRDAHQERESRLPRLQEVPLGRIELGEGAGLGEVLRDPGSPPVDPIAGELAAETDGAVALEGLDIAIRASASVVMVILP